MQWRGSRVLITGASGGIGAQFARSLAQRGADLVLVARSADRLDALAQELRATCHIRVATMVADLAEPAAGAALYAGARAAGPVDAVVNNAGFATHGPVASTDPELLAEQVHLNIGTVVATTRSALPSMLEARRGAVINIASTAAFQPVPLMSVYAASKSFVLSFTQALARECRGSGVDVLAVCPGPVDTGFFERAGVHRAIFGTPVQAGQVVDASLAALGGRSAVVPGARNRVLGLATRLLPTSLTAQVAGQMAKRG